MSTEALKASPFCEVVTASDTDDFPEFIAKKTPCRRIRATAAGNINVVFPDGRKCVYPVLAGESIDVQARRINSASTTATGFVVSY